MAGGEPAITAAGEPGMHLLDIIALLITVTALFSFLNYRYLGLPTTIGVMLIGLVVSLSLVGLENLGVGVAFHAEALLSGIDFSTTLMNGMLSFLLFAGALHVDLNDLAVQKWPIATLATGGVVISTLIVGFLSRWLFVAVGLDLPLIYCLLFGALISPTDPIAVLALLRSAGVSKRLETKITGESLFNDGVGVVIFLLLLGIAAGGTQVTAGSVLALFATEALGGALYGVALGGVAYWMLKQVDNYQVEVLITLATVAGGYALAHSLHVSGPIAMVVAGLLIGNQGRRWAMSDTTREHLDTFWELIDEMLNTVLFVLIGLEILLISFKPSYLMAGGVAVVIVLFARLVSVGLPISIMKPFRDASPDAIKILTWGGLRGGISVALALSLPLGAERDAIVTITYCVVVFSILVQGLTIGRLVARA